MKNIEQEIERLKKNEFFIKSLEGLKEHFEKDLFDTNNPVVAEKINEYGFFIAQKVFESFNEIEKSIKIGKSSQNFKMNHSNTYFGGKEIRIITDNAKLDITYDDDLQFDLKKYIGNKKIYIDMSIPNVISLNFHLQNGKNDKMKIIFNECSIFTPLKGMSHVMLFKDKEPTATMHFLRNIVKDNIKQLFKISELSVSKENDKKNNPGFRFGMR